MRLGSRGYRECSSRVHAATENSLQTGSSWVHAVTGRVPLGRVPLGPHAATDSGSRGYTGWILLGSRGHGGSSGRVLPGLTWQQRLDLPEFMRLQRLDPLGFTRLQSLDLRVHAAVAKLDPLGLTQLQSHRGS